MTVCACSYVLCVLTSVCVCWELACFHDVTAPVQSGIDTSDVMDGLLVRFSPWHRRNLNIGVIMCTRKMVSLMNVVYGEMSSIGQVFPVGPPRFV